MKFQFSEYAKSKLEESYDNYGIDYHIDKDVYERIYLDGIKTGIAGMMMLTDEFIDNHNKQQ